MVISAEEFVLFCERTIDRFEEVNNGLGDELINQKPPWDGASSPFQLTTHAFASCTWWVDHMVCHRPSSRSRPEEFVAVGSVAALQDGASETRSMLRRNRAAMTTATVLIEPAQTQTTLQAEWTVGAALIHAYEELAQHLGHLEMTADVLSKR